MLAALKRSSPLAASTAAAASAGSSEYSTTQWRPPRVAKTPTASVGPALGSTTAPASAPAAMHAPTSSGSHTRARALSTP